MAKKKIQAINLVNKKAKFEYAVIQKYTAGIVLLGTEIKAIRESKLSFADSYCTFMDNELYVRSLSIAEYSHAGYSNHDPKRDRKLLLHKKELRKLQAEVKEKGLSIIPLRVFIDEKGLAKMDIALAKGKKLYDKRATIKEREQSRNLKQGDF